jgi:hypothetical protein
LPQSKNNTVIDEEKDFDYFAAWSDLATAADGLRERLKDALAIKAIVELNGMREDIYILLDKVEELERNMQLLKN